MMNSMFRPLCFLWLIAITTRADAEETGPVTFSEHIAPIIFQNCAGCHRPGEAAPFSLTDYQTTKRRSKTIRRVVEDRYMPPWHADEGWGEFHGNRRLSEEQIKLITTWVESGAPEGDPAATPPLPEFPEGWSLGEPDLVVEMPEAFEVYADGKDIYRYFALPLNQKEDRWVRAVEVRPSARSVVHHVLFFLDSSGKAREMDGADGTVGFRRRAFKPAGSLGGWAVGGSPLDLGSDYALPLPAGTDLVLQTHFHPSGKVEREQTKIGIYFNREKPDKQLIEFQVPPSFGALTGLNIGPGENNYVLRDTLEVPEDMELITAWGHAHQVCSSMQAEATLPDGTKKKLFRISEWDFNWQDQYVYSKPVFLPKGTTIEAIITYDNSEENLVNPFSPPRRIFWGEESDDEMGSIIFQCVAANQEDHPNLDRGLRRQKGASTFRFAQSLRQGIRRGLVLRLDSNYNDQLELSETPIIYRNTFKQLDSNSDGVVSVSEIDAGAKVLDRAFRRRK